MNYLVPGEVLARLLVVAGARLDADEIGEMVHRIKSERNVIPTPDGMLRDDQATDFIPPAKPE